MNTSKMILLPSTAVNAPSALSGVCPAKRALIVVTMIATSASLAQAFTTANLLGDPGFETQSTQPSFAGVVANFATNQGIWGAENGSFDGMTGLVSPIGTRMHGMQASGNLSQTIQITSLASYATEIAAGNASFNMNALFNVHDTIPAAEGTISVYFFSSDWNSRFGNSGSGSVLDDDMGSWQQISHSGAIPTNAAWIGTELGYRSNSLGGGTGYVDGASLTITTVPEPSSALIVALGSLGLLARRKRG